MTKRLNVLCCVVVLVSAFGTSAVAERVWNRQTIVDSHGVAFYCGSSPTLALLYGVQPVVSNYDGQSSSRTLRMTAFGWSDYSIAAGFIAGDGRDTIQSYDNPVLYGQDGRFYSTDYGPQPLCPITLDGYRGPAWPYALLPRALVDADRTGTLYMASGNAVAELVGSSWSKAAIMPWGTTYDLAVSAYGDIALCGSDSSSALVSWYDFKSGTWLTRRLGSSNKSKADVEWDRQGNLGIAYVEPASRCVKFDYLDMQTSVWSSEIVGADQSSSFAGVALAYDRFDNPVIVSGNALFYDPAGVPEPSSILAILTGLGGLGAAALRRRR